MTNDLSNDVYAGIGSRETPDEILRYMKLIAHKLDNLGYVLRSGGARGADTAFEHGSSFKNRQIFMAQDATTAAIEIASKFHSARNCCDDFAKSLHGRNAMIMLGENLDCPVKFVICWTKNGKAMGGTGLGIRIAESYGIPIFNLKNDESLSRIITGLKIGDNNV